jgi:hypothetical protein
MTRTSLAPSTRDQLLDEDIPVAFTVAHAACTGTRAIFLATPVVQSTVRVPRSHEEAMKLPERKEYNVSFWNEPQALIDKGCFGIVPSP